MTTHAKYVAAYLEQIEESVARDGHCTIEWWEARDVSDYSDSIPTYTVSHVQVKFWEERGFAYVDVRAVGYPTRHRTYFSSSLSELVKSFEGQMFDSQEDASEYVARQYEEAVAETITRVNDCLRVLKQPALSYPERVSDSDVEAWITTSFTAGPLRDAARAGAAMQRGHAGEAEVCRRSSTGEET